MNFAKKKISFSLIMIGLSFKSSKVKANTNTSKTVLIMFLAMLKKFQTILILINCCRMMLKNKLKSLASMMLKDLKILKMLRERKRKKN